MALSRSHPHVTDGPADVPRSAMLIISSSEPSYWSLHFPAFSRPRYPLRTWDRHLTTFTSQPQRDPSDTTSPGRPEDPARLGDSGAFSKASSHKANLELAPNLLTCISVHSEQNTNNADVFGMDTRVPTSPHECFKWRSARLHRARPRSPGPARQLGDGLVEAWSSAPRWWLSTADHKGTYCVAGTRRVGGIDSA